MFSYQHRYHAGNFADVHKHIILVAIINYLKHKDKPFAVMDVHAGEGIYDLKCTEAQKIQEFRFGITPLFNHPQLFCQDYLDIIKNHNEKNELRFYPGSSAFIAATLRSQDRGILIERHPQAIQALRANLGQNQRLNIHARDSNEAMVALVPFKEKRGLVFLDPTYEVKSEYTDIVDTIAKAYAKFPQGIFALWYPILAEQRHKFLIDRVQSHTFKNWFHHEWFPYEKPPLGQLQGSGIVILNPPYLLEQQLQDFFTIATASFRQR